MLRTSVYVGIHTILLRSGVARSALKNVPASRANAEEAKRGIRRTMSGLKSTTTLSETTERGSRPRALSRRCTMGQTHREFMSIEREC